ncbi:MAG: DUF4468 domain-containing protein [Bacteroidaceae bacterium]|nr:DUF4468 domain-containing protein [Bacteroidaceae bacterium]
MKRYLLLIVMILAMGTVQAQLFKKNNNVTEAQYHLGAVPVVNGKVAFEEVIQAEGLSAEEIETRVNEWIKRRFTKPTVIRSMLFDSEQPNTTIVKSEEYIVFKNTFLVLSRARIYYYLTITAEDGQCTFNMSRITYWYDDEDEKGGIKMKAENWITDEMAFNKKGRLKKFEGKFRRKTIDLKELLIEELTNELTSGKK